MFRYSVIPFSKSSMSSYSSLGLPSWLKILSAVTFASRILRWMLCRDIPRLAVLQQAGSRIHMQLGLLRLASRGICRQIPISLDCKASREKIRAAVSHSLPGREAWTGNNMQVPGLCLSCILVLCFYYIRFAIHVVVNASQCRASPRAMACFAQHCCAPTLIT